MVKFQTFSFKIDLSLNFNWNDLFTRIHYEINLTGASVIGVIVNA